MIDPTQIRTHISIGQVTCPIEIIDPTQTHTHISIGQLSVGSIISIGQFFALFFQ
jgi:hypothetical protein